MTGRSPFHYHHRAVVIVRLLSHSRPPLLTQLLFASMKMRIGNQEEKRYPIDNKSYLPLETHTQTGALFEREKLNLMQSVSHRRSGCYPCHWSARISISAMEVTILIIFLTRASEPMTSLRVQRADLSSSKPTDKSSDSWTGGEKSRLWPKSELSIWSLSSTQLLREWLTAPGFRRAAESVARTAPMIGWSRGCFRAVSSKGATTANVKVNRWRICCFKAGREQRQAVPLLTRR